MAQEVRSPQTALPQGVGDVKDQTLPEVLFALFRVLGVLFTGAIALIGFLKTKDLAGLIAYVKSSDLLAAGSTALSLGILAYGMFRTWLNKRKLVTATAAAPNSVGRVVKPGT
jgi:hypothetical protein